MSIPDFSSFTPAQASDPSLDAATLSALAQARPDLRAAIAANPNFNVSAAASMSGAPWAAGPGNPYAVPPAAAVPVSRSLRLPIAPYALAVAAVIGLAAQVLPLTSIFGRNLTLMADTTGNGKLLMPLFTLLVIAGAVIYLVNRNKWLSRLLGIVGILGGLLYILGGIGSLARIEELGGTSGIAVPLLFVAGVGMVVFGVLCLLRKKFG